MSAPPFLRRLTGAVSDLSGAVSFLTILPTRWLKTGDERAPGYAFSYFPLVGLTIGLIVSAIASIRFLPADLVAFLALLTWIGVTGALHLDGFADSCDGLLATVAPERRLEIMKDPRVGSWALVGMVVLLLGKWIAIRALLPTLPPLALVLPPVLGRWAIVLAVGGFPGARTSGLAAYFRAGFGGRQIIVASLTTAGICGAIGLLFPVHIGWRVVLLIVVSLALTGVIGRWAAARLGGGLTGDVYGAICELVEATCLILLSLN